MSNACSENCICVCMSVCVCAWKLFFKTPPRWIESSLWVKFLKNYETWRRFSGCRFSAVTWFPEPARKAKKEEEKGRDTEWSEEKGKKEKKGWESSGEVEEEIESEWRGTKKRRKKGRLPCRTGCNPLTVYAFKSGMNFTYARGSRIQRRKQKVMKRMLRKRT